MANKKNSKDPTEITVVDGDSSDSLATMLEKQKPHEKVLNEDGSDDSKKTSSFDKAGSQNPPYDRIPPLNNGDRSEFRPEETQ